MVNFRFSGECPCDCAYWVNLQLVNSVVKGNKELPFSICYCWRCYDIVDVSDIKPLHFVCLFFSAGGPCVRSRVFSQSWS